PILATRKPPGRTLSAATPPARKVSGFVGASQACANSPTVTFFDKHTRSQGPSLHRHYPASSVSGRRRRARLLSRWPPSAAQLGRGLARRLWPRCLSTKPRLQSPPRRTQRADLPSRPGEFHPEPLTDPDMNLSIHPARAIHRRLPPSVEIGGLLRSPVGPSLQRGWPPPFAPWALPHFSTTTEESAPAWPVGISASRISRLCLFPWHRQTGSQVPCKSLDKIHAFYTPDTAWPVCRSPPRSSRGMRAPPVLMSPKAFRCVCEGSLALVSLIHTWRDHCHAFSTTLTT